MIKTNTILCGDSLAVLQTMPDGCVQMCVTSPPYYGLRDYGMDGQIGLEPSPAEYVHDWPRYSGRFAASFRLTVYCS